MIIAPVVFLNPLTQPLTIFFGNGNITFSTAPAATYASPKTLLVEADAIAATSYTPQEPAEESVQEKPKTLFPVVMFDERVLPAEVPAA